MKKTSRKELMSLLSYDPETGLFSWKTSRKGVEAGSIAGSVNSHGYVRIAINRRSYSAHALAILFMQGYWPISTVDHKNRDRADNRLVNLRVTTQKVNCRNSSISRNNKSGVTGVCWHKNVNKWQVLITTTKRVSLGYFSDFFEAVCKRKSAELNKNYFVNIDY